jgi:copper(I)-binding protein
MLIGLKNQFTVGEKVELTLEFKEAGPIVIQAEVRSP